MNEPLLRQLVPAVIGVLVGAAPPRTSPRPRGGCGACRARERGRGQKREEPTPSPARAASRGPDAQSPALLIGER
ncbi:hypothetical protein ACWEPN_35200 [Nonomuraea wenchangensis]